VGIVLLRIVNLAIAFLFSINVSVGQNIHLLRCERQGIGFSHHIILLFNAHVWIAVEIVS
jgi:hypothetical protein